MSINLTQHITKLLKNQPFHAIQISGLNPSASAFILAKILSESKQRVAVVCPSAETALQLYQDLKTFLTLANQNIDVEYFPGWEHSPYQGFNPSLKNRIRRLRALYRLYTSQASCLITDVDSVAQRCISFQSIQTLGFSLNPGDCIAREELVAKLEAAGFTNNDPVEDPGSYAIRGGLCDVFSSSFKRPLRLDFFGDELESIRSFDPLTQRSDPTPIERAHIIPVSELVLNPENAARAKSEIKKFCDEYGIPKQARDELVNKLDSGAREPTLDYLAPYFSDTPQTWLLDLLFQDRKSEDWKLVVYDVLGVESRYDQLRADLKAGFQKSIEQHQIVCPWERLYVAPEIFNASIKANAAIELNAINLGLTEEPDETSPEDEPALTNQMHLKLLRNDDLKGKELTAGKKISHSSLEQFCEKAKLWADQSYLRAVFASTQSQAERISFILSEKAIQCRLVSLLNWDDRSTLQIIEASMSAGFRLPEQKLAFVTDSELFGPKKLQATRRNAADPAVSMGSFVSSLEDLNIEDLVVHTHHGIGRYRGLVKLELDQITQDFLLIEFSGSDKLYLPVYRLDQVQRYVGATDNVALDKLGSNHFEKTKSKVKEALQDLAHQLLQLYAKRATRSGFAFSPAGEAFREFEARFPYAETPDQLKAIEDIEQDMESGKIMDRLVCGDVGYGKTEVAMRAAYRAAMDGKQVAVLVPTTVLALQHERSFMARFKDTPVKIGILSRFKTTKEIKETLAEVKEGKVDILIGTHRLISKDVSFKDLGLLIIDEEQHFGVEHKERIKGMKVNTDVLTLTATPIPRTLQMSMMGLRDITVINTPPLERLSVRTYVARFEGDIIAKAIEQEMARGGQVFFIHNRVQSIHAMAEKIQAFVPKARIIVAHGQLLERDLEKRMVDFYNKKADVLICSTIIESGLDIPSANTMIINRADTFGLSQLYQLRGRVGRSPVRAYCYLLLPEEGAITDLAKSRLEVIQRFVDLGSGFKIASHDLELRGGGDLLGKSQSGHIASIGYELYTELLDETIQELRGKPVEDHFDPEIKIPVTALLPESYVPDVHQRLGLYKKLSSAASDDALHDLELEMQDRFGKLPIEVSNLFWLIRIKQLLRHYHIKTLVAGKERTSLEVGEGGKISLEKVVPLVQRNPKVYSLTPDSKLIMKKIFTGPAELHHDLQGLLVAIGVT